jgi:hypothetical protein
VRIIWILTGLCLALGVIASMIILVGDPNQPWQNNLRELSALVDVLALLFWIGIFAIYWARRSRKQWRNQKRVEMCTVALAFAGCAIGTPTIRSLPR